ncbi:MAG TPA: autotransporter-associated beta strand repeat-containing protein [Tepidisphaeraceae bacterium]|nr:autotransporter-associated beta strand repeat-containing protein [Tepidisphaeraceae bacterium]
MRKATPIVSAILFAAALSTPVHAVTQYWDPNQATSLGGSGAWDTTTSNWAPTNAATASTSQWVNGDDAVFGGVLTSAGTVTLGTNISANSISFIDTPAALSYTINGGGNTLTLGSIVFPVITPTATAITSIVAANIAGSDLNILDNNTTNVAVNVTLANANSFTGNLNLGGAVPVGAVTSGWRMAVSVAPGAIPSTAAINYNRTFSQIVFASAGDNGVVTNDFHFNNSNLSTSFNSDIGASTATTSVTLSGVMSGSSDLTFGVGASGGNGVITLTNHSTYTGATRDVSGASGGVVRLGVDDALPTGTDFSFGSATSVATPSGGFDLNGHNQTFASIGSTVGMTGAQTGITNTQGATLSTLTIKGSTVSTYAGPLGIANNLTNLTGSSNNIALVLDAANTGTLTLKGNTVLSGSTIVGYSGTTYSGGTSVNGGTLLVANTTGSATGSGPVSVGTKGFLGSTSSAGTISGNVSNSGTLIPGGLAAVGTLTLSGGLTANADSNLNFDISSSGNDKLALGGTSDSTILSLPGTAQSVNINLNDIGSSIVNGATYSLFSYPATTTLSGLDTSASGPLKIVRPTSGLGLLATYSLTNNTSSHTIDLSVSGTFGARKSWHGDSTGSGNGSGTWDIGTTANFVDASSNPAVYNDPDDVTFSDASTQGTDTPITISITPSGVTPANVTVNNSSRSFVFQGGAIMSGNLTKAGTGVATFSESNTAVGTVTVSAGTLILSGSNAYTSASVAPTAVLEVASDASLGAVPSSPTVDVTLTRSASGTATLRFDGDTTVNANRTILLVTSNGSADTIDTNGHNVTIAGQILASSSINIAKAGFGTLTLTGDNSTALGGASIGVVQINTGTVNAAQDISLGKPGGAVNFAGSGGIFQFGASFNTSRSFGIGSVGTIDTNGFNPTISGVVSGAAAFTKAGAGTLTLAGTNTLTGATIVNGGTLALTSSAWAPVLTNGGGIVNSGKLVFDYTGTTSPVATVNTDLTAGYAVNFATGPIRTTNVSDGYHGLGYYDDGTSKVTVMYTYLGDANLDGKIDGDDYALIDRSFAKGGTVGTNGWASGDFNYDGVVNSADYMLIDTSFLQTHPASEPSLLAERESEFGSAYVSQLVAAVPEPTSIGLMLLAAPMMLRRRRAAQA